VSAGLRSFLRERSSIPPFPCPMAAWFRFWGRLARGSVFFVVREEARGGWAWLASSSVTAFLSPKHYCSTPNFEGPTGALLRRDLITHDRPATTRPGGAPVVTSRTEARRKVPGNWGDVA